MRHWNLIFTLLLLCAVVVTAQGDGNRKKSAGSNHSFDTAPAITDANGDPLRPLNGPYDSRTKAGRDEIQWLETRLYFDILVALTDVQVTDIVVDVLAESVVVVVSATENLDDELRGRITNTCTLFTGFTAERTIVVTSPYE